LIGKETDSINDYDSKNHHIENLGETLDFIIYGKNQEIIKDPIEENIIFNFFENFIIVF